MHSAIRSIIWRISVFYIGSVLLIVLLAVLALPLLSSLQFYAGYPLRVLTAELSQWLAGTGELPLSLSLQPRSLEDVFLRLTGRSLID